MKSLIDKYSDSSITLKQQLDVIDNQLIDLNKQRDALLERISFNEINIQNIMQQATPSLSYLSNELIKIILSFHHHHEKRALLDINKHYRSYKIATCYYKLNKKQSFEYLINQNGMRDKVESSVANPNKQLSLTFNNKSFPDVSMFANVHSLTLTNCSSVRDLSPLGKLSYLDLSGTRGITYISPLVNLDTLILSEVKKMGMLPTNLNVKHLTFTYYGNLRNIQGLANCVSLKIFGSSFEDSESNLACLGCVDTLVLTNARICRTIDGWRNQKLTFFNVSNLQEIKNLRNMECINVNNGRNLKTLEDIDGVKKIDINNCESLLKIDRVSNIDQLNVQSSSLKKITNVENIDKITLSSSRLFTTITNICNIREVSITSCSSLLDLSPLTHPQANVQVLVLNDLDIVNVNVQGRIPDVTLNRCKKIINVTGLASCRKLTIQDCSAVVDVSALGLVEHLTLDFYRLNSTKTFQGLAALGRVQRLVLKNIDMASLDLGSYVDVQKLTLHNCTNINMPLNTLNLLSSNINMPLNDLTLLSSDRGPTSFNINGCRFDDQSHADIHALKLSSELKEWQSRFYFNDNKMRLIFNPSS